jgi:hypothetical protein
MNDTEFMQFLSAAHRAGVKKIGDRLAQERKDCLKITRARLIALNPDAATPQEKAQIAACPHCAKLVEQMKAGLSHPSLGAIVRWLAGAVEGDEAKAMRWHMEEDGCRPCKALAEVIAAVEAFLRDSETRGVEFFNEAELQHELGYWLRTKLAPGMRVFFERPANSFFQQAQGLVKKEIDLVVAPEDRSWHFAIELKCPRNGRVPETMFDACRDLQLLEQLLRVGFVGGLFLMHVDDPSFYQSGLQTGIYSFFRGGQPLTGTITKPTGRKDQVVHLHNSYRVQWQPYGATSRYWLQVVTSTPN